MIMRLTVAGFLAIALLASIIAATGGEQLFAQAQNEKSISVKSTAFEQTTLIEFTNNGETQVDTFRLWLGADVNFKSFKTEKGWTGTKNSQGVLVFKTDIPVEPGESVKFGIKTDKPKPGINWKALDRQDNEIGIGRATAEDINNNDNNQENKSKDKSQDQQPASGILSNSVFRLVPEKPNVGSTIRVSGQNFAPNENLEFFIDNQKLESFQTNNDGNFMITTKIPNNTNPDRVNFIVKDTQGNEKTVSLRLGEGEEVLNQDAESIELTVKGLPSTAYRGAAITGSGTATPGSTVTASIKDPDGNTLTTNATEVNQRGEWSFESIIPNKGPLGKYIVEISHRGEKLVRELEVETSEKIVFSPTRLKFNPGETISFNGTGIPNEQIELIFKDPRGSELFSDIIQLDETGKFSFEYPTEKSTSEGTYTLFAIQGKEEESSLVGLGQLPASQLTLRLDKLNYKSSEDAIIKISGPAEATVNLLVIDPADKDKLSETIKLGPNGKTEYTLDLQGYSSGVYTAIAKRGSSQFSETFTVGLQVGSGEINVRTTKTEYLPGEPILVLGNSNPNVLIDLILVDPDGNEIKKRTTFTNKEGIMSDNSFRVPSDAKPGTWTIKAQSGSNFGTISLEINPSVEEGLTVRAENIDISGGQRGLEISGANAEGNTVVIEIISSEGEIIDEITIKVTDERKFKTPWIIPGDTPPGEYTIKARDAHKNISETTVDI